MRVIALVSQKGGVGKTTTTLNLGAALGRCSRKVLLLDLDPQGNLTEGGGVEPDAINRSIYDVLVGDTRLCDVTVKVSDTVDIVPSHIDLAGAEAELLHVPGKDLRLKAALKTARGYDYILIDCPPSLGQLTLNALAAASEVIIPVQAEFYALKGLKKLMTTIDLVHQWSNKKLKITGVLATRYDARRNLNREVVEQLREHFGKKLLNTVIRENIALAEAPTSGRDIYSYRAGSYGAEDYAALCSELILQEVSDD